MKFIKYSKEKILDSSDCHIGNYNIRSINRVNFKQCYFIFFTELSLCNSFPVLLFIPFTALMLASDLISGECERNELKLLLTRHVSRTGLLFGKLAAVMVYELFLTDCCKGDCSVNIQPYIVGFYISKYICRSHVNCYHNNSNSSFCFFCRYYICILQKWNICLWDGSCSL